MKQLKELRNELNVSPYIFRRYLPERLRRKIGRRWYITRQTEREIRRALRKIF